MQTNLSQLDPSTAQARKYVSVTRSQRARFIDPSWRIQYLQTLGAAFEHTPLADNFIFEYDDLEYRLAWAWNTPYLPHDVFRAWARLLEASHQGHPTIAIMQIAIRISPTKNRLTIARSMSGRQASSVPSNCGIG
jgi:hypothetical protein